MSSISAGTTSTTALVSTADTTGSLVLKTGASATTALTLDTSQNATFAGTVTTVTGAVYPLVSGTAVSASGTSVDFTGIPATAKRVTVMFNGISTSGTSNYQIQVGSGSYTTSGYVGQCNYGTVATQNSTGLIINNNTNASLAFYGSIVLTLVTGNTWVSFGNVVPNSANSGCYCAGGITLSGALDRVRITTVNGTDTFDAGTINIMWE
jgi:hypothetical protein